MALELLSGPHRIVDGETGVDVSGLSQFAILWVDPVGLIAPASTGRMVCVQMDGTAFEYAKSINNRDYGLALLNGSADAPRLGEPWYSLMQFSGSGTTPATEWALDRVTHAPGEVLTTTGPGDVSLNYAHLADRFIKPVGSRVDKTISAADAWTTEVTFADFANGSFLSWARDRGFVWVGSTDGRIVLYDYVNKVAASPVYRIGLSSNVVGLFYSAKHDVFVAVHTPTGSVFDMYVWARTPLPASVSNPTAAPAVAAGRAVTLTTRVLGADSDPCPDEVVAWTLTGEGTLESDATVTDEDGYATNRLTVPVDAAGPDLQIDVEVVIP